MTDLDRGRRPGTFADFLDYVRVIGALDVIHQEGGGPLEPTDLPVATRHLDMYRALAATLDKTWHCLGLGAPVVDDAIEVMCLVRGVSRDDLARQPSLMTVINTNSPLRLDGPMSDGLIEMASHGQPVVATPFTLAGAMSPISLAGTLAQQNAEALFMVTLSQLARPGAPVVYGAFTSNVDMRTGSPAFGTPEYAKGAIASGQLARRHGLPWRSSNATASNIVDAQAAYESEIRPLLSDWRNFETWQEDGARTATERANRIWKRLLAEYAPPVLDPFVSEALDAFVARRTREIERDRPRP